MVEPNGKTVSYSYDHDNQLTQTSYSDSTPTVSYGYDQAGNRTSMTDGAGTVTYSHDNDNQLLSASRGPDTFSYTYDLAGNVASRTYPNGTAASYAYNQDEQLSSVTSSSNTTNYAYDPAGNLTQTTLPAGNGYLETRTYDRASRLIELDNIKNGTPLSDFAYTLDPVGNPTTVVRSGGISSTTTYGYDANDRLTGVCFQTSCPNQNDPYIRWTYDQVGNRLTETRPSGTTNYTYNADDELLNAGSTTYTYDANGNETSAGTRTLSYNAANQLTSTTGGGTTTNYSYDGDANRLSASTGGGPSQTTNYIWDTNGSLPQLALERDGHNTVIRSYLYGVHRIWMATGGSVYYYLYDRLGSVVNLTSSIGATEWTYSYEPFGAVRTQTQNDPNAPANPMQFTGELLDTASGLYDLRARQYDPGTGRFLQTDPAATTMSSGSAYDYTGDRPTCFVDPTGESVDPGSSNGYCSVEVFDPKHNYCSVPHWVQLVGIDTDFMGTWNKDGDCYYHDLCYGSNLDRKFCDDCFYSLMKKSCKSHYGWGSGFIGGWWNPVYDSCRGEALSWYKAIRHYGLSHYHPHCGAKARAAKVLKVCPASG